jgi:hypothetical protein
MPANGSDLEQWAPETFRFYRDALAVTRASGIPFLVGGAYALAAYTGIVRHTKDLDLFVRPTHAQAVLHALAAAGYRTELTFPHWLGKAFHGDDFVDVIFSSGNGLCTVDDSWFAHAQAGEILRTLVRIMPAEEMIWQKAYIMERERFDGADVLHMIRACGRDLDWDRLVARFGPNWRVLLCHLVLFNFVYSAEQGCIPERVLRTLTGRLFESNGSGPAEDVCRGTLLSRSQYLADTQDWGYEDARLPHFGGKMTPEQIERWTEAASK